MIKLTMTEKGGEPKALSFEKDEITIGRVSGNDIVLPKGNVSKRHSKLTLREGRIEIVDLKSTNGTYVNGKKITEVTPVGASDRVYVGDFLITVDGLAGEVASPSRKMPPPPPPPRVGSSSAKLPTVDDQTGAGGESTLGGADDEEEPLAARPPRAGRVPPPPPPPPPPPRRPPTPVATRALDEGELPAPSPAEVSAAEDATGDLGLFERRKTADHAAYVEPGTGPRRATGAHAAPTGSHAVPTETGPLPSPPGQAAPAPDLAAAVSGATGDGLEALLADPAVTQIVVTSPDSAFVDRGAGLKPYAPSLGDPNTVADTFWRLANLAVPPPSPDNPVVDVRFPDGTRLSAVFPPVAPTGVVGAIRRPASGERELGDLVPPGGKDVEALLEAVVRGQRNVLLTGDAAAIAPLVLALGAVIPSERRVVSVGIGSARARAGWTDLTPSGDSAGIVRVASSLRADHLVIADAIGSELADVLTAAAHGQEGILCGVTARTIAEGLARLEALAAPLGAAASVAPLVCSTIDLVVHVVANADGSARIVDVAEPKLEGGHAVPETVAAWRSEGPRRGTGPGKVQVTGVSARLGAALSAAGQSLPSSLARR
jgi:pilus assembly protein CpaF